MAEDPEAQAQLARLLRDDSLRHAPADALRDAATEHFDFLVEGIVAEAAASDDVFDQQSAAGFVRLRMESLSAALGETLTSRVSEAALGKIATW